MKLSMRTDNIYSSVLGTNIYPKVTRKFIADKHLVKRGKSTEDSQPQTFYAMSSQGVLWKTNLHTFPFSPLLLSSLKALSGLTRLISDHNMFTSDWLSHMWVCVLQIWLPFYPVSVFSFIYLANFNTHILLKIYSIFLTIHVPPPYYLR